MNFVSFKEEKGDLDWAYLRKSAIVLEGTVEDLEGKIGGNRMKKIKTP